MKQHKMKNIEVGDTVNIVGSRNLGIVKVFMVESQHTIVVVTEDGRYFRVSGLGQLSRTKGESHEIAG